jgi:hypothetical protein
VLHKNLMSHRHELMKQSTKDRCIYVTRTNKMHTFSINDWIQLHCLRHVANNQVFILRKICTCSFMAFLSCIRISGLVDQTAYTGLMKKKCVFCWFLLHTYTTMHGSKNVKKNKNRIYLLTTCAPYVFIPLNIWKVTLQMRTASRVDIICRCDVYSFRL